jgi:integrase
MADSQSNSPTPPFYQEQAVSQQSKSWAQRYGKRHRLEWIKDFPAGIAGPKKVRIYRRADHFILQWWDKAEKRNLCERIDGDLVAAIARARQIDERLEHFRSSGVGVPKTQHAVLVERFRADLHSRADAGELDPRTVRRYESALRHYQVFVEQPSIHRQFPHISSVDRKFALELMAHLRTLQVRPNGHPHGQARPMRRPDYVLDVVRAMYDWAADPQRGKLMPEGFRNPFLRRGRHASTPVVVSIGEPDITVVMAADFLGQCDAYQLRLFAPIAVYGMRAAEPCYLFQEHVDGEWLRVPCLPKIAYHTKGRREKRLPVIPPIAALLSPGAMSVNGGLLYLRRGALSGVETPPLVGMPLGTLTAEFQRRCAASGVRTAADRRHVRDQLLHDAGAINYDHVVTEFNRVVRALDWPRSATLKDFRHLFATGLENAGMPEHYRKFLMGQSSGRAAIVTYTHLNEIRPRFEEAVQRQFQPLIDVIVRRASELSDQSSTNQRAVC